MLAVWEPGVRSVGERDHLPWTRWDMVKGALNEKKKVLHMGDTESVASADSSTNKN